VEAALKRWLYPASALPSLASEWRRSLASELRRYSRCSPLPCIFPSGGAPPLHLPAGSALPRPRAGRRPPQLLPPCCSNWKLAEEFRGLAALWRPASWASSARGDGRWQHILFPSGKLRRTVEGGSRGRRRRWC
jgi:hypothetical protein